MSLKIWQENGWLKPHKTSKEEIGNLLDIVDRDSKDAQCVGLSSDARFVSAYNAALKLATILLYVSGYRPQQGQSHHYRTIQAISEVLGKELKDDADYLDACRNKRNAAEYDYVNAATDADAKELIEFLAEFRMKVENWVKEQGLKLR